MSGFGVDYREGRKTGQTISRLGEGDQIHLRFGVGNLKSELTDIVLLAFGSNGSDVELLKRVFVLFPTTRKIPLAHTPLDSSNPFNNSGGIFQPMEHQEVISTQFTFHLIHLQEWRVLQPFYMVLLLWTQFAGIWDSLVCFHAAVQMGVLHRMDINIAKRRMQTRRKVPIRKNNNPRNRVNIVPFGTEAMKLDELRKKSSANDETTVFIRNALECKLRVGDR
mgnify:CR=1 FL=1